LKPTEAEVYSGDWVQHCSDWLEVYKCNYADLLWQL